MREIVYTVNQMVTIICMLMMIIVTFGLEEIG